MTVGQWLDIWTADYLGGVKPRHIHYDVPFSAFRFSPINSAFFAGCYRFHTLGINDRVAWTLLASGICSRLFHKMLQNFIPQSTDPGAAIKAVYR